MAHEAVKEVAKTYYQHINQIFAVGTRVLRTSAGDDEYIRKDFSFRMASVAILLK